MYSLRPELMLLNRRPFFRLVVILVALIAVFGWRAVAAESVQLRYEATLGGTLAGSARVELRQDAQSYSVVGSARSKGLLDSLNPWKAEFGARGEVAQGVPLLEQYHYVESDNRKSREVTVTNGQLRVVKNGKLRAELAALPGLDILSALFVEPSCSKQLDLHTGRHGYHLESIQSKASPNGDVCRYRAQDEDGDSYQVSIEFVQLGTLRVPRVIELSGFMAGRMKLESYQLATPVAKSP